jgi:hypothetical protein
MSLLPEATPCRAAAKYPLLGEDRTHGIIRSLPTDRAIKQQNLLCRTTRRRGLAIW